MVYEFRPDGPPAVERAKNYLQVARHPVDFDQRPKIWYRDAQCSGRLQHPPPFCQHGEGLIAVEVLQDMRRVDQLGRFVGEDREVGNIAAVVDVWKIGEVDIDKAGKIALPAPHM